MKIAHITSTFLPVIGGAEIWSHQLVTFLQKKNVDVVVYVPSKLGKKNAAKKIYDKLPYKVQIYPMVSVRLLYKFPFIFRIFYFLWTRKEQKNNGYDYWHASMIIPAGFVVSSNKNLKKLLTPHGVDIQERPDIGYGDRLVPYKRKVIDNTLKKINYVVAISKSVENKLKELNFRNKVINIPNGVDFDYFKSNSIDINLKAKNSSYLKILTIGRISRIKGSHYIPLIAKKLENKGIRFKWILIGRNKEMIEPLLTELNIRDKFECVGEISFAGLTPNFPNEEIRNFYKEADCFVLPSTIESFGIVLIEAMAAGLPVVASNTNGCRDVVTDGYNGLLSEVGDVDSFAENIARVLINKTLRNKLIQNGLNCIHEKYDWNKIATDYVEFYKEIKNR